MRVEAQLFQKQWNTTLIIYFVKRWKKSLQYHNILICMSYAHNYLKLIDFFNLPQIDAKYVLYLQPKINFYCINELQFNRLFQNRSLAQ